MNSKKKDPQLGQSKTFEESLDFINNEINKRKHKWNLTILAWMDYEDVAQILRIHIHKKWHLYDQKRPLGPWVSSVIASQTRNIIRNNYGNYCRPCLRCSAAEPDDGCTLYQKQCSNCPLYAHWLKTKKSAYDAKLPVSLELHTQEVFDRSSESIDVEKTALNIHKKMESILKPLEYKVYKYLYMDNKTEEEAANLMGYRSSEKGRSPGYKQIKNIKKGIIKKIKIALVNEDIDIIY